LPADAIVPLTLPGGQAGAPPAIYLQVQHFVQELVGGGAYAPGDKIPSERMLAERLGASRMTVRKAIDRLVAVGLLDRAGTGGTRVATPRVERPIDQPQPTSISKIVEGSGGTPGSRLLHFALVSAEPKVARRLQVPPRSELVLIRRLRTVDDRPFCVETSHLPAARVPGLVADDLARGQSLYVLLRERYAITVAGQRGTIRVGSASAEEALLLGLDADAPVLLFRSVVLDQAGRPIEDMISVNHPFLVVFRTSQDRAIG
jgi:GntR family transcriptional regulator